VTNHGGLILDHSQNTTDDDLSSDGLCAFFATQLTSRFDAETDLVFVSRSDASAERIFNALKSLVQASIPVIFLPNWDCLPYDRVTPSRQAMGRRMDAMRDWLALDRQPGILITSLEVILQRVPPMDVIANATHELAVGSEIGASGLRDFANRAGYVVDGVVDEPGEVAFLQDVVDIFPAGADQPMRIYLTEEGKISEMRFYDPLTQRTETSLQGMEFGPASELIVSDDATEEPSDPKRSLEHRLLGQYQHLASVFDLIGKAPVLMDPEVESRVDIYLAIISEAREAQADRVAEAGGLYLTREEWDRSTSELRSRILSVGSIAALPQFFGRSRAAANFTAFLQARIEATDKVLITGKEERLTALIKRLNKIGIGLTAVQRWADVLSAPPGTALAAHFAIKHGFVDDGNGIVVISVEDVLGPEASSREAISESILLEPELQIGDVVVHEEHGVGVLRSLETTNVDGIELDAVRLEYHKATSVLVPMAEFGKLWRYGGEPDAVTLDRLHTDAWLKKRGLAEQDVAEAARHLAKLAKQRESAEAAVIVAPQARYRAFAGRFPYTLTVDQESAIDACLHDLASGKPMNRVICGDVGFGKTEIALRAAAAVALAGRQIAVLAPTTVLARQHFSTFERRFAGLDITVRMLSRAVCPREIAEVKTGLASGEVDIVVGTQAILAKDISFSALGLVIADEEHRFGVGDKEKMRHLAPGLHTLTMSATPIPRSLQGAMIGIQDVSLLRIPPARRRPVRTSLVEFDEASIATALRRERRRAGQSFFVVPRIEDIDELQVILKTLVPEMTVLVAHGKMPAAEMDDVVVRFAEGDGDILLSTNIIESGLDIPQANTIFIWRADRFGLAQLHQLRGRVGRGRAQGFAYLLSRSDNSITESTRKRLDTMIQFDRLGSGLAIALRDLDLRGAGDLAGEEQAVFRRAKLGLTQF
jgi:transcription-repair coupling factor (superfamily II helicase)